MKIDDWFSASWPKERLCSKLPLLENNIENQGESLKEGLTGERNSMGEKSWELQMCVAVNGVYQIVS